MRRICALLAVPLALVAAACGSSGSTAKPAPSKSAPPTLSATKMNHAMEHYLSKDGLTGAFVECPPHEKIAAGNKFLCTVTAGDPYKYIEVTVINSTGDITYNAIQ